MPYNPEKVRKARMLMQGRASPLPRTAVPLRTPVPRSVVHLKVTPEPGAGAPAAEPAAPVRPRATPDYDIGLEEPRPGGPRRASVTVLNPERAPAAPTAEQPTRPVTMFRGAPSRWDDERGFQPVHEPPFEPPPEAPRAAPRTVPEIPVEQLADPTSRGWRRPDVAPAPSGPAAKPTAAEMAPWKPPPLQSAESEQLTPGDPTNLVIRLIEYKQGKRGPGQIGAVRSAFEAVRSGEVAQADPQVRAFLREIIKSAQEQQDVPKFGQPGWDAAEEFPVRPGIYDKGGPTIGAALLEELTTAALSGVLYGAELPGRGLRAVGEAFDHPGAQDIGQRMIDAPAGLQSQIAAFQEERPMDMPLLRGAMQTAGELGGVPAGPLARGIGAGARAVMPVAGPALGGLSAAAGAAASRFFGPQMSEALVRRAGRGALVVGGFTAADAVNMIDAAAHGEGDFDPAALAHGAGVITLFEMYGLLKGAGGLARLANDPGAHPAIRARAREALGTYGDFARREAGGLKKGPDVQGSFDAWRAEQSAALGAMSDKDLLRMSQVRAIVRPAVEGGPGGVPHKAVGELISEEVARRRSERVQAARTRQAQQEAARRRPAGVKPTVPTTPAPERPGELLDELARRGFTPEALGKLGATRARALWDRFQNTPPGEQDALINRVNAGEGAPEIPVSAKEQVAQVVAGRQRGVLVPPGERAPGFPHGQLVGIRTHEGVWIVDRADAELVNHLQQSQRQGFDIEPAERDYITGPKEAEEAPPAAGPVAGPEGPPAVPPQPPARPVTLPPTRPEVKRLALDPRVEAALAATGHKTLEEARAIMDMKLGEGMTLTDAELNLRMVLDQAAGEGRFVDTEGEGRRQAAREAAPEDAVTVDIPELSRPAISAVISRFKQETGKDVWYEDDQLKVRTPEDAEVINDMVIDQALREEGPAPAEGAGETKADEAEPPVVTGETVPPTEGPAEGTKETKEAPPETPAPEAPGVTVEADKLYDGYKLPEGSKGLLVHGHGRKKLPLEFEAELDRAVYVLASRGARMAPTNPLLKSLIDAGLAEPAARAAGNRVLQYVKAKAGPAADGSVIRVPRGTASLGAGPKKIAPPGPPPVPEGGGLKTATRGGTAKAKTDSYSVDLQYAVVEAGGVRTSNDDDYDQPLQGRDRTAVRSEAWVDEKARKLDVDRLGENILAQAGAPIVNERGDVESGNGRVLIVRRAYSAVPENAAIYRQWLKDNWAKFGLEGDPSQIDGMERPLLVRVRKSEMSREDQIKFAREANKPEAAPQTAGETGRSDAERLTPEIMDLFKPGDDGDIGVGRNAPFIRAFFATLTPTERGELTADDGGPSQAAKTRIRNAVFAATYENPQILKMLAEDLDTNVRTLLNGLLLAAPKMTRMKAGILKGELGRLDITKVLGDAVQEVSRLRAKAAREGEEVDVVVSQYVDTPDMFEANPEAAALKKRLVGLLGRGYEKVNRNAQKVADLLNAYADMVEAAGKPGGGSIFGGGKDFTALEVLRAATEKMRDMYGEGKGLFGEEGEGGSAPREGAAGKGPAPAAGEGAEGKAPGEVRGEGQRPPEKVGPPAITKKDLPSARPRELDTINEAFKSFDAVRPDATPDQIQRARRTIEAILGRSDNAQDKLIGAKLVQRLEQAEKPTAPPAATTTDDDLLRNFFDKQEPPEKPPGGAMGLPAEGAPPARERLPLNVLQAAFRAGTGRVEGGLTKYDDWKADFLKATGPRFEPYVKGIWNNIKARRPDLAGKMEDAARAPEATAPPPTTGKPPVAPEGEKPPGTVEPGGGERPGVEPADAGAGGGADSKKLITARPDLTRDVDVSGIPEALVPHLADHQKQGVMKARLALESRPVGAFMLADGTGAGKTREILAVAKWYADEGRPVYIVAPHATLPKEKGKLTGSYVKDAKAMGIEFELRERHDIRPLQPGKIYLTTYDGAVPAVVTDKTVLIPDEAHALKNEETAAPSQRALRMRPAIEKAYAVMFVTATPMDKPGHLFYMRRLAAQGNTDYDAWMKDMGFRKEKLRKPKLGITHSWGIDPRIGEKNVLENLLKLNDELTDRGLMVKRELSMEPVTVNFRNVKLPPEAHEVLGKIFYGFGGEEARGLLRANQYMQMRRQLEPYKVGEAVRIAMEARARGKKVAFYVERINYSEAARDIKVFNPVTGEVMVIDRVVYAQSEGTAKLLREALEKAGVKDDRIAELHGNSKTDKGTGVRKFQEGDVDFLIATAPSAREGLNLDDATGANPREVIIVTAPFDGMSNVQAIGRFNRMTTKSKTMVHYITTDTLADAWGRDVVIRKLKTMKATVQGQTETIVDKSLTSTVSDPEAVRAIEQSPRLPARPAEGAPIPVTLGHRGAMGLPKGDIIRGTWDAHLQRTKRIRSLLPEKFERPIEVYDQELDKSGKVYEHVYLVHQDLLEKDKLRITRISPDGALGHDVHGTLDDVAKELSYLHNPRVVTGVVDGWARGERWKKLQERIEERDAEQKAAREAREAAGAGEKPPEGAMGLPRQAPAAAAPPPATTPSWVEDVIPLIRGRHEILDDIEKRLDRMIAPAAIKRNRPFAGLYYPDPMRGKVGQLTELQQRGDIMTVFHEMGHHFQNIIYGREGLSYVERMGREVKDIARKAGVTEAQIKAERDALLKDYGAGPVSATGRKGSEAYAQFVRLQVINPAEALRRAPILSKYWLATLGAHPDIQQVIDWSKKSWELWNNAPGAARVKSHLVHKARMARFSFSREKFFQWVTDDMHPFKKEFDEMVQSDPATAQRIANRPDLDARVLADTSKGYVGQATSWIEGAGTFKFATPGKIDGPSLARALEPVKDRVDDFEVCSIWREHKWLEELARKEGKPYDPKEALGIDAEDLADVGRRMGNDPAMQKAFTGFQKFWDAHLQYWLDAGFLTPEKFKAIKARNQIYVPLARLWDEVMPNNRRPSGALGNQWHTIKFRHGSQRPILSPIESAIRLTFLLHARVERNETIKAFYDAAIRHPQGARWLREVQLPKEALTVNVKRVLEEAGIDASELNIPEDDLPELVTLFRESSTKLPGERGVWLWKNGKRIGVQFHDMDVFKQIQRLDAIQSHFVMRALHAPVRLMRATIVMDPTFMLRNLTRDQVQAWIRSQAGYTMMGAPSNFFTALTSTDLGRGLLGALRVSDDTIARYNKASRDARGQLMKGDPLVAKLERSGASMAHFWDLTEKETVSRIERHLTGRNKVNPVNWLRTLRDVAEELGLAIEMGTRLQEARRMGLETAVTRAEMLKAGHAARIVTIDFGRAGLLGRAINQFSLFFNPAVQGWSSMYQTLKDPRTRNGALVKTAGLMGATMLLAAYNQKDERYWKVSPDIRASHWVMFPPWDTDIYWKLPKSQQWGLFATAAEDLVNFVAQTEPEAFDRFYRGLINEIPPKPFPSGFLPFIEDWGNWQTFRKRPVVPRGLQEAPESMQYDETTSGAARGVAAALEATPGARKVLPEGAFSPMKVDNVIKGLLPGLGPQALEFSDWVAGKLGLAGEKTARGITRMPVLRGFIGEVGFNSANIQRAYEMFEEAAEVHAGLNKLKADGRWKEANEWRRQHRDELRAYEVLRPAIDAINKARSDVKANQLKEPSGEKKREFRNPKAKRADVAATRGVERVRAQQRREPFNGMGKLRALFADKED